MIMTIARMNTLNNNNTIISEDMFLTACSEYLKYKPIPVIFNINTNNLSIHDLITIRPTDIFGEVKSMEDINQTHIRVELQEYIDKDIKNLIKHLVDNGYTIGCRGIVSYDNENGQKNIKSLKILSMQLVPEYYRESGFKHYPLGRLGGDIYNGI